MSGIRWWLADAVEMVRRNLLHIRRTPELLLDVTVQPIMFVLLFRYVFGGAISTGTTSYVNYLIPGIFVQTITFAAVSTGALLATDLTKGMIDRFRSLPMSQSAIITGRTFTDLLRGMLAIGVMTAVGLLVGFRPEGGLWHMAAAYGLLLAFGFSLAWIGVAAGALVRTPEAVYSMVFLAIFPLTFASSAFVPPESMPAAIEWFAKINPISTVVDATRALFVGAPAGSDVWGAVLWIAGLTVVFATLSVHRYRRAVSS